MSGKNAAGETVTEETNSGEGEHVAKALEHVASIVSTIKTAMSPGAAVLQLATDEDDVTKGKTPTVGAMMKAIGLKKEDYDAAMSKLQKQFGLDANAKFQNQQPPVAKAKKPPMEGSAEEEADESDEEAAAEGDKPKPKKAKKSEAVSDDPVDMLMAAISKSYEDFSVEKAKHITKSRLANLKKAQEILKAMIDEIEEGTQPPVKMPASSGFGPSGVQSLLGDKTQSVSKAAEPVWDEAKVTKAIQDGIAAAVAPLAAELEAVKKARPASNSLEGEGGTESKVSKSKSLWGGVI
jgi:hypothetical protein